MSSDSVPTNAETLTLPPDVEAAFTAAHQLLCRAGAMLDVINRAAQPADGRRSSSVRTVIPLADQIGREILRYQRQEPPIFPLVNEFASLNNPLIQDGASGCCVHEAVVRYAHRVLVVVGDRLVGEGVTGDMLWYWYSEGHTDHPFATPPLGRQDGVVATGAAPPPDGRITTNASPETLLNSNWHGIREAVLTAELPDAAAMDARLRAEACAAADARQARPAVPRVVFDDDRLTVTIDGRITEFESPTPYLFVKKLAEARPGIVSSVDLENTPRLRSKNIPRLLSELPSEVRQHIRSGPGSGYWFVLGEPNLS